MSAWRIILNEIYRLGGTTKITSIKRRGVLSDTSVHHAIHSLIVYGLVTSNEEKIGRRRSVNATYTLTEKGRLFCEGKIEGINFGPLGMKFTATWLRALPETSMRDMPWQLSFFGF